MRAIDKTVRSARYEKRINFFRFMIEIRRLHVPFVTVLNPVKRGSIGFARSVLISASSMMPGLWHRPTLKSRSAKQAWQAGVELARKDL